MPVYYSNVECGCQHLSENENQQFNRGISGGLLVFWIKHNCGLVTTVNLHLIDVVFIYQDKEASFFIVDIVEASVPQKMKISYFAAAVLMVYSSFE